MKHHGWVVGSTSMLARIYGNPAPISWVQGLLYLQGDLRMTIADVRFLTRYRREHACCPRCGSDEQEMTCIGSIPPEGGFPADYRDPNTARCHGKGCSWRGKVHDLVPRKADTAG